MPAWIIAVEWLARLVLLLLIGLSVWSVSIILERRKVFKLLQSKNLVDKLTEHAALFATHKVEQALAKEIFQEKRKLEKGLAVLGTLGSTTPFIGLLGTILGIIVAFGELSIGKSDTNAIMFALAEALILTAVGLFVAIPAVIAFNIFSKKIKYFFEEVQSEIDLYLAGRDEQHGS